MIGVEPLRNGRHKTRRRMSTPSMQTNPPRFAYRLEDHAHGLNRSMKPARRPAVFAAALCRDIPANTASKPAAAVASVPINAFTPAQIAAGLSCGLNPETSRGANL
jgi:hypothetical protein